MDNDDDRHDPDQSPDRKKKRKSKRSSSTKGAAEPPSTQEEIDAQSKRGTMGRTAAAIPGAVSEGVAAMEPPTSARSVQAPTRSTSIDAMAKSRARRTSSGVSQPGAAAAGASEAQSSRTDMNSLEADIVAKNRARPMGRSAMVGATPSIGPPNRKLSSSSTASLESRTIVEQRAGLQTLEQDIASKLQNRHTGVNASVVDPVSRKISGEARRSVNGEPRRSGTGANAAFATTAAVAATAADRSDVQEQSKDWNQDHDIKHPNDNGQLNDGFGEANVYHQPPSRQDRHLQPMGDPDHEPSTGFGAFGEIVDGGIEAFVADQQVVDATGVALVKSDEELEELEKQQFRRYMLAGICCLIVITVAIVVPVVIVFGKSSVPPPTESPSSAPSGAPSFAPTSSRFADILDYVSQFSSPDSLIRENVTSPQYLAADWVANIDEVQAPLESAQLTQRYLLAVFYFSTGGDKWEECNRYQSCSVGFPWLAGTQSECLWDGVRCSANQVVEKILIGNQVPLGNNLVGTLPVELSYLSDLSALVLIQGGIKGTIPTEYGRLSKITTIFIQDHLLSGIIPEEIIANAPGMDMLALGNNKLSGPIPTTLGSMPVLRDLQLTGNQFTGTIPTEIGSRGSTMRNLELNRNKLVGTIPDSIYNLVLLSTLSLDENELTGTISTLVGQVTNLESFEVYGNQLDGSLPDTLYTLPALKRIRVGDNGFTGTVSDRLVLLNQTLQEFNAPNTNISGAWPNALFESLPELSSLILHGTDLTGAVSQALCSDTTLVNLTVPTTVDCSATPSCCDLQL